MDISSITGPISATASTTNSTAALTTFPETDSARGTQAANATASATPVAATAPSSSSSQVPVKKPEPAPKPAADDVKLSQQAQAELLKSQGESLSEIATRLGVSVTAVDTDLYLNIPATPSTGASSASSPSTASSSLTNVSSAALAGSAASSVSPALAASS